MIGYEEISEIAADSPTAQTASENLVAAAIRNGGIDNITVILCEIKE